MSNSRTDIQTTAVGKTQPSVLLTAQVLLCWSSMQVWVCAFKLKTFAHTLLNMSFSVSLLIFSFQYSFCQLFWREAAGYLFI